MLFYQALVAMCPHLINPKYLHLYFRDLEIDLLCFIDFLKSILVCPQNSSKQSDSKVLFRCLINYHVY